MTPCTSTTPRHASGSADVTAPCRPHSLPRQPCLLAPIFTTENAADRRHELGAPQTSADLGFLMNPGEGAVTAVAFFTPAGAAAPTHLLSGAADGSIAVWGAGGDWDCLKLLKGHKCVSSCRQLCLFDPTSMQDSLCMAASQTMSPAWLRDKFGPESVLQGLPCKSPRAWPLSGNLVDPHLFLYISEHDCPHQSEVNLNSSCVGTQEGGGQPGSAPERAAGAERGARRHAAHVEHGQGAQPI